MTEEQLQRRRQDALVAEWRSLPADDPRRGDIFTEWAVEPEFERCARCLELRPQEELNIVIAAGSWKQCRAERACDDRALARYRATKAIRNQLR